MPVRSLVRLAATLVLALAAALAWRALQLPLPWMMGPLLATALASIAGAPTASAAPLRNAAQCVIGASLGLYFTPEILRVMGSLWWVVLLTVAWALAVGWVLGEFLHRVGLKGLTGTPQALRATSYFSGAIGGASEMTLLAEREGARTDLVAGAHSIRVLVVTVIIPFGITWADLHGLDGSLPGVRDVRWLPLVLLLAAAGLASVAMSRLRWANPWFIGGLAVAMGLSLAAVPLSAMPPFVSSAAQLVIGVSLGVLFRREFLGHAPRWMAIVALATLGAIALCLGFAWVLAQVTGLGVGTLVLGTSPGGIAEMAITAKVLQLGVPMVTAFQVFRLVAVLLLVEPLYRWRYGRAS